MAKVYSMTGFARAEGKVQGARVTVEARAVNNKYLDLKLYLPREFGALEQKIAELCRGYVARGRVEVRLNLEPGEKPVQVAWNRPLAEGLIQALQEMKAELGLQGEPDLSLLAGQKDVILIGDLGPAGEELWPELEAVLKAGLEALQEMRGREGVALTTDILARLSGLEQGLSEIGERAAGVVKSYRDKLDKRIRELLGGAKQVEPDRLAQEVALFADRADITEELVRARSHVGQFRSILAEDGPKGRKLDFLVQELFRETTTLGNKAQDADVSRLAVELKAELEKIREQVQNLE